MALAANVLHFGDAEHAPELAGGHDHWPGVRSGARSGLRKGCRHCGMKGDIALDLLYDLVDVSVEDGDEPKRFR